jgi:hypothetical protein
MFGVCCHRRAYFETLICAVPRAEGPGAGADAAIASLHGTRLSAPPAQTSRSSISPPHPHPSPLPLHQFTCPRPDHKPLHLFSIRRALHRAGPACSLLHSAAFHRCSVPTPALPASRPRRHRHHRRVLNPPVASQSRTSLTSILASDPRARSSSHHEPLPAAPRRHGGPSSRPIPAPQ